MEKGTGQDREQWDCFPVCLLEDRKHGTSYGMVIAIVSLIRSNCTLYSAAW